MERFRVILDLYQLGCLTLFGYMAYLMCRQFIGNQDSSQVSYKKFESGNQGDDNAYPMFSICTPHSDGAVFYPLVDTDLHKDLYNHPTCINTSEMPHHWCEIGLYQNMLLGNQEITPTASSQNFNAITNSLLLTWKDGFLWKIMEGGMLMTKKLCICLTKIHTEYVLAKKWIPERGEIIHTICMLSSHLK